MIKSTLQFLPQKPTGTRRSHPAIVRWTAAFLAVIAALSVGLFTETAHAQDLDLPTIQLERFRPAPGPADYLNVYGTDVAEHLEWDASFYLSFADNPLQISTRNSRFSETVDAQSTVSLMGSIGLYDRFEIGLLIPATVFQSSQGLQPILPQGSENSTDLSVMGLNDWRLSGKFQILDPIQDTVGLALVAGLYAPLATQNTLTSDGGVGGELTAAAEYFIWRGIRVGANLGYRYRPFKEEFRDSIIGDEFVWGAAIGVPVFIEELDAILEFDGAVSLADKDGRGSLRDGEVPAEVKLAGRYAITDNWTLTAGAGSGLNEGVGSPDLRLFIGLGGYWVYGGDWSMDYKSPAFNGSANPCPDGSSSKNGCPELDTDGDGVPDSVDRCPDTPEGTAVFTDGCTEKDFEKDNAPVPPKPVDDDYDDDGILNDDDDCPDDPENFNGFLDDDGCPDDPSQKVTVTKDKIVIIDKVHFDTSKATIRPESFDILNQVVDVLDENPQIELLRIEGHTDDRGRAAFNEKLSRRRAASVREYLIDNGVDSSRLTSEGFGESTPIADNETEEGRAKNRRVEFTILKTESSVDE